MPNIPSPRIHAERRDFNPDMTVSAVWREVETFYPVGEVIKSSRDWVVVPLEEVADLSAAGYAEIGAQNTRLEKQIETERDTAKSEKDALAEQHASALAATVSSKDAELATARSEKEALETRHSEALAAKDARIAELEAANAE